MRRIKKSGEFKRSQKRMERSGRYTGTIRERISHALIVLANDGVLEYSYRDHELHGKFEGSRECHILFDLLLVYRYEGDDVLWLERFGSHSEVLGL